MTNLQKILKELKSYTFKPKYNISHLHTIYGKTHARAFFKKPSQVLFKLSDNAKILIDSYWQKEKTKHPTIVTIHGLEGSSKSKYFIGITNKAYKQGYNVINVNLRNCGNTEKYCKNLYHAGISEDINELIDYLIHKKKLKELYLLGISMGGNIALKLAGEYGKKPPKELRGIIGLSPLIDLKAAGKHASKLAALIYRKPFMRFLHEKIEKKAKYYPEYDITNLSKIKTFKEFDEAYCKYYGKGFSNAQEYYNTAAAKPYMKHIHIPTLIIQSEDDPLIPLRPLKEVLSEKNPHIIALVTKKGGHVGFISKDPQAEDEFWAENRLLEFCNLLRKK